MIRADEPARRRDRHTGLSKDFGQGRGLFDLDLEVARGD
jgi:hypothetical protein